MPELRPELEDLVADRGKHRDADEPAQDHDERLLLADQREREDRQQHKDHQELRPAAMVGRRVLADRVDREWVACLERVDRHVLGAVVLEHPVDVRRARDERQVGQEQSDLDHALERRLRPALAQPGRGDARHEQRQQAEGRDGHAERDKQRDRDRALAELDVVLFGLDVGTADEPARADDQRLVQDDEAAHERPSPHPRGVDLGVEVLGGGDDAAVRMAQSDRDRVATAHEDALHEGLSSVGEGGSVAATAVVRRQRRRVC